MKTTDGKPQDKSDQHLDGFWNLPEGWEWSALDDVAPVNPRRNFNELQDDDELVFVPMAAVEEVTGGIDVSARRPVEKVRTGYTKFCSGDVIFAKITPCMENGKIAIIPELPLGYGAGSTEFHVIKPELVLAEFVFYWVSQQWFRDAAEANMTGTAGQKRVQKGYLSSISIPVPPKDIQQAIVAKIEELFHEVAEGQKLLGTVGSAPEYKGLIDQLRQSILLAAFKGDLVK